MNYDKDFLKLLDNVKNKEVYARLTSLTFSELPIELIEGRVTGGTISLDGKSSSRRTCNLNLIAKDVNVNQFYWGLTHKFKVEIGIKNIINSKYPDIIWFKQGIFVITNFNISLSTNGYNITINGKDKMSLLNGDLGGSLFSQTDFGNIESYNNFYEKVTFSDPSTYIANKYYIYDSEEDKYNISTNSYDKNETYYLPSSVYQREKIPIKTIIREAVHTYGKEPYYNIIINDLEEYGKELLEYRGSNPIYLTYEESTQEYLNMYVKGETECWYYDNGLHSCFLSEIPVEKYYKRVDALDDTISQPLVVQMKNPASTDPEEPNPYVYIAKIEYGDTPGYYRTDLTYDGDLVANVGETLTSVLDKIKNMLGDFEYFYDIDGHFVWQRQKTYENRSWNNILVNNDEDDNDILIENAANVSSVYYNFTNNNIITAFNNTPNLNNLRNDFSIWGTRKGITGADIPIHLRYAIDKKPDYYISYDKKIYSTTEEISIQLTQEYIQQAIAEHYDFERKPNPNGLPTDWWYMSDWYNYYKKLSGQAPTDYIRFYATNRGGTGSIDGYVKNFDPGLYFNTSGNKMRNDIWLFHLKKDKDGNDIYVYGDSDQHNSTSSYTINEQDGTKTIAPFSGCTAHKYTFFINIDENGNAVDKEGATGFFYKPNFPNNIAMIIEEKTKEYIEQLKENIILCDWREVIYQMAKDYYKHNQDDNFYSQVMLNNGYDSDGGFHYPNGITGYEQYYADIVGFWRELYNPEPELKYETQGGYYTDALKWANDGESLGYYKETIWVPFEQKDTIFTSEYYLPEEKKKYNDEIIENISEIESTYIILSPSNDYDNFDASMSWKISKTPNEFTSININLDGYEIFRSFYSSSGFAKIATIINTNYIEENLTSESVLGNNKQLILYYKVRGYKDIEDVGRIYTQWSNRCSLTYQAENVLDDDGNVTPSSKTKFINSNTYMFSSSTESTPITYKNFYVSNYDNNKKYWSKAIYEAPETLNFWFDFLDSDSELAQFSVPAVGSRPKSVNDSKVTSIYFKETPSIIFIKYGEKILDRESGYSYIQLDSNWENLFTISAQGKSAKDVLDEYIYKFGYCIENVSITCLPIYYLEPNTRIFIYDENSKINGEYIVNKITLPLTYNGTMSITAEKAVNRIY